MTADERFDRIERSIEELKSMIEAQQVSIGDLKSSHSDLTRYLLDFRQETIGRLQTIETRLDFLESTVRSIDTRLPALSKAIQDFGVLSAQLVREQSRLREADNDLTARVAKLEALVATLIKPAA